MSLLDYKKDFHRSSEGMHLCCRCIHSKNMSEGAFTMTTTDWNSCDVMTGGGDPLDEHCCCDYKENIETEDNGSGYWITKCKFYEYDENWNKPNYYEYMKSPEWKAKREERLKHDNFQCQICHTAINLVVHHVTYDRLGNEDLYDIVKLCQKCHEKVHEKDLEEKSKCGNE